MEVLTSRAVLGLSKQHAATLCRYTEQIGLSCEMLYRKLSSEVPCAWKPFDMRTQEEMSEWIKVSATRWGIDHSLEWTVNHGAEKTCTSQYIQ